MGWLAAGAGSRGGLGDTPLLVGDVVGCQQHTIRSHLDGAYGGWLYVVEMYQCVIALTLQHYLRGSDSDGHFGQWFEMPVQKPTGSVGSTVGLKRCPNQTHQDVQLRALNRTALPVVHRLPLIVCGCAGWCAASACCCWGVVPCCGVGADALLACCTNGGYLLPTMVLSKPWAAMCCKSNHLH